MDVDGPPNQLPHQDAGPPGIDTTRPRDTQATVGQEVAEARLARSDRIHRLDRALATRTRMAGYTAEIDRPAHIVALIGEPPRDVEGRARWRATAGAIESYQARSGGELPPIAVDDQERPTPQAAHLEIVRQKLTELQEPAGAALDEVL